MASLGIELPREIARVRDVVLPVYDGLGNAGVPAAMIMRATMDAATRALSEGDVLTMLRAYEALKGFEL